ncbi:MAG: adenylate kinase [Acidobacteria bacterium]|nr:adenylate kinase [Acidobacteriota bacterium]
MSKIIVLMGAPGAGKGTQARLLQQRMGLPQISTGDMFRALLKTETPLAGEVRPILASGQLVPDELTIRIVRDRTGREDCGEGYILDGFPRTTVQAEMLEQIASEQGHHVIAILVDVPFDVLEKRLTGRRTCPVCGEIYNVYFKPPAREGFCDVHPEVHLAQRADDNAETIKTRLMTYQRDTQPLLDYYDATDRLRRADGTREPEAIYADIEQAVTGEP